MNKCGVRVKHGDGIVPQVFPFNFSGPISISIDPIYSNYNFTFTPVQNYKEIESNRRKSKELNRLAHS